MRFRMGWNVFCAAAVLGFAAGSPMGAEEPQADRAELIERLDAAEQRIKDLEARNSAPAAGSLQPIAAGATEAEKEDPGYAVGSDLKLSGQWQNTALFSTPQKDFTFRVRGRIQQDWGWFLPDGNLDDRGWHDGAQFRRARIGVQGTVWEVIQYTTEWDVADASGIVGGKDIHMDVTALPYVGNFRAGHFYEPFGLENFGTSDLYITFMERAAVIDAFDPDRNIGVMIYNDPGDGIFTYQAGIFRPNSASDASAVDSGGGEYAYTGRLTWNPWYENEGRCVFMVGAGYSFRNLTGQPDRNAPGLEGLNNTQRYRTRIPLRINGTTEVNSERVIDTGALVVDRSHVLNAQALLISGPFSVQGEFYFTQVNDALVGAAFIDPSYSGCYVMATYHLTGENRRYRRATASIDRPMAHEPFFLVRRGEDGGILWGRGAWELAVRYDYVDVGNAVITNAFQGRMEDVVFGVNWVMNPNFRMQFNYVIADVTGLETTATNQSGTVHALGTRFQWDW